MAVRNFGSTALNQGFSSHIIEAVWRKGIVVPGINPAVRRKDACGAWIDRDQYGVIAENGTGWEIDHVFAVSRGGSDSLGNLQPLQWQNNRAKADSLPGQWVRAVFAPAEAASAGSARRSYGAVRHHSVGDAVSANAGLLRAWTEALRPVQAVYEQTPGT